MLTYALRLFMAFGHGAFALLTMRCAYLWPSATQHSFAVYTLRVLSNRFAHLCAAHTKHSRCLLMRCAYLWPSATQHSFAVYTLRVLSNRFAHLCAAHTKHSRCSPCASLIVIHDEYDSRPYEPVTSFQQPKEVTKKGRSPANFLIHIFDWLQCQTGERKHPCKAFRLVQTSLSGHLTSQLQRWKIGVVEKPKHALRLLRLRFAKP
ncbi:hypothetical protein Patl_3454 [Paraglaciecola sp. T6c]|nr:hypothetical protein Patl_3454 [Paraglaciecola sp. T6c]